MPCSAKEKEIKRHLVFLLAPLHLRAALSQRLCDANSTPSVCLSLSQVCSGDTGPRNSNRPDHTQNPYRPASQPASQPAIHHHHHHRLLFICYDCLTPALSRPKAQPPYHPPCRQTELPSLRAHPPLPPPPPTPVQVPVLLPTSHAGRHGGARRLTRASSYPTGPPAMPMQALPVSSLTLLRPPIPSLTTLHATRNWRRALLSQVKRL